MKELVLLAWQGLKQKPKLSALMIINLAVGITLMLTMSAIVKQSSSEVIGYKANSLFTAGLNYYDAVVDVVDFRQFPRWTFQDAQALKQADLSYEHLSFNYTTEFIVGLADNSVRPISVEASGTDREMFNVLDAPFIYGTSWNEKSQQSSEAVAVISKNVNDHLFGGANSVGQFIQVQGEQIQVVGVVDLSNYKRRFQDLSFSNNYNHDVFIPLNYAYAQNFPRTGQVTCRTDELYTATNPRSGSIDMLKSTECGYLTVWFQYQEDKKTAHLAELKTWLNNYIVNQQEVGRFQHTNLTSFYSMGELYILIQRFMAWEAIYLTFSYLLFGICLVNTVGILLAKFQANRKLISLYRALGANRRVIMKIHFLEILMLTVASVLFGFVLAFAGLELMFHLRMYQTDYMALAEQVRQIYQFDGELALWTTIGIFLAVGLSGLYPVYRSSRVSPAAELRG
ncbi:FtsX-like permease family protein [Pseudoalteromonas sp. S4498]|uniref:ABC transporter permease n=1 Tax=Pseudoalteromonas TaxID=53246 RepID=UPI00110870D7|nr:MULTISPECIES: ABC transporter permease [Pseudoalteromonas]MCG9759280.1 ABC transporter permease [Pseudoalteromonas sp. Isolate6]NKC18526.1 FtsX-like permease family protein [Pseudoalteromonas galatheae]